MPWGACVLGELAGGQPVTLYPFYPTQVQTTGFQPTTTTVDGFAGTMFIGTHIQPEASLEADTLGASLHDLDATAMGVIADKGLLNPHAGSHAGTFTGGESREFLLPDGGILVLHAGESGTTGAGGLHVETHAGMHVTAPSAMATDELERKYLEPIRELVVLCTRRPSYVQTVSFGSSSDPRSQIAVLRRPWPSPSTRANRQQQLGLNLARVSNPDEVIWDWFELRARVGAVWRSFFSTLSAEDLLESRFLNLMAFMEGYHRAVRDSPPLTEHQEQAGIDAITAALKDVEPSVRDIFRMRLQHVNSQTQKERLIHLATDVQSVLGDRWPFDPTDQSRAMVDTRNWMTHWGLKTKHVDDSPEALVSFYRQLELIAYVAILRDLQLGDDEIFSAIAHGWLHDNLLG
jgi:hypothetical protein